MGKRTLKANICLDVQDDGRIIRIDKRKRKERYHAAWVRRGSPKPGTRKEDLPPRPEKPPRTLAEVQARAQTIARVTQGENKTRREIARVLKAATRVSGEGEEIGGTALTILKRRQPPMATLIEKNKVGGEEVRAADDISRAFMALSGGMLIRPLSMERVDGGGSTDWPARVAETVVNYQRFAIHWSTVRKRHGHPMLEVLIAAIVDERPFSTIEGDLGLRHGKAAQIVVAGLRDYAARVTDADGKPKWVDQRLASQWKANAEDLYRPRRAA